MQVGIYGVALAGVLLLEVRAFGAEPYKSVPGPYAVASVSMEWKDAARGVVVPVKIYYPKEMAGVKDVGPGGNGGVPLIVFSHGLGGSRDGYQIWGEHWASYGYVVVHPTHVGSDSSVLAGLMGDNAGAGGAAVVTAAMAKLAAAANVENAVKRCKDVSFVIDQMEKVNAGTLVGGDGPVLGALKGKIDLKHIGMAGHSFGAITTQMIAGQVFGGSGGSGAGAGAGGVGGLGMGLGDPRITAGIAMSPQPSATEAGKAAFAAIKIPVLYITGTADDAPVGLGNVKAADRRVPFDNSVAAGTELVIFAGAVHMTFAPTNAGATVGTRLRELRAMAGEGRAGGNTPEQEAEIHTLVKECTTAYWDQWLKGDATAKGWLEKDFAGVMGGVGTFERK